LRSNTKSYGGKTH